MSSPAFGDERLPARFWDKVAVLENGCWQWTGAKHKKNYGHFNSNGTCKQAHRVAYEALIGPIPRGLVSDHNCHDPKQCELDQKCPHRSCVNPAHLDIVTQGENSSADRRSNRNRHKTHCAQGHPFDEENTYHDTRTGRRACKACQVEWGRKHDAKRNPVLKEKRREARAEWLLATAAE